MNTTKTATKPKTINQEIIMSNRSRNHAMKTPTNSTAEAPTMYETENEI